jgi:uncharacterized protein
MTGLEILNPVKGLQKFNRLCALGIMTKAPEAGKVKTRLTPPLTGEEAAKLNVCFLRDISSSIATATRQAPAKGVGIYTPAGSEDLYIDILPKDFLLISQRGDGFGARLTFGLEDLLKVGFGSVCLINSDSPTVPAERFVEAANELAKPGDRVVIGPSEDGGYYLIGLKKPHRRLFEEIDWSTERVFEQTLARASEIELAVHELSPGFDVDDRAMLRRLCDELLGSEANHDVGSETQKFLSDLIRSEGRKRIWPIT